MENKNIDEKTPVRLTIKVFTIAIIFIISNVFIAGVIYNSFSTTLNNKLDKDVFARHSYIDSVRFDYYQKDFSRDINTIQKDIALIKKKLGIEN